MAEIQSSSTLISKLKAVLLKQRLVLFTAGLVTTISAMVAVWILLSLLANVMVLPVWFKISLLTIAGAGALYVFGRFALTRLVHGTVDTVAVRLEEKHPDLKGRLVAAVEFSRMKVSPGYSKQLIEITEKQALREAGLINFNEVVSFFPLWKTSRYFAVAAIMAVLLLTLFPGFFSYSFEVYSNPTSEVAPPLAYQVVATPGSTEWIKYRDINIGASVFGMRLPDVAWVHYKLADGRWQKSKVDLNSVERFTADNGDSLQFGITLRQINKSLDYYVEAGRIKTEIQKIDVVDRPRVNDIALSVFYPDYTGLPPMTMNENNGSFSAVVGSRANLKIETNLPVERATLVFDDSSRVPLKITGKSAEASLVVDKSRSYYVELIDHLGEYNPDPIQYYVTAVPDEYPSVDVLYPGFNANLNDAMRLPLKVHIYDDYGFSSLVLKYTIVSGGRASDENVAVIHFSDNIKTEGEVEFNWDLGQFGLYPGDYVSYYFEVADNDRISGPKVSKSRQYIARLPSLDEMISQTEQDNTQRINNTEKLIKTGKELAERLKDAMRKMEAESKQSRKADWQQQKELESIAEKNLQMMDKIDKMADQMRESMEQSQQNALMSREIMEKMAQIQKLFEEVATPEMKEAQKKLMEALKSMDKEQIEKALKDFKMSQEELMQRLERTLALLKKMQVEQKMEAMIRKAEEMVERQGKVNDQTEASEAEKLPQLSKSEDEIKKSMEDLKKQADELKKMLEEAGMKESREGQEFAKSVKQNDADQNMENMSQSLEQQDKKKSSSEGATARSKLFEMLNKMQEQQSAMKGGDSEKLKQAMRRAIDDANYLSKDQEKLLDKVAEMAPQSMVAREMAMDQQDLQGACAGLKQSIGEMAKASPFVAIELNMLVDNALKSMESAKGQLDIKRSAQAVQEQRDAMTQLNQVSLRLMESLEKQSQCESAQSCNNPNMSKLESICNNQNKLNQKTQQQCNNPSLSSEAKQQMRVGMDRLAAEQASIRKSLQQLEQEFGNSRQVLGRLSDIVNEMKKVEEELSGGEAGQQTTERQLQIYSRMLEATRSLQRKDYSEQRQATTAKGNMFYVPPELSSDVLNDQTKIEDRLRQYLGDDYPAQYEEQIKAYFRALLQLQYNSQGQKPVSNE